MVFLERQMLEVFKIWMVLGELIFIDKYTFLRKIKNVYCSVFVEKDNNVGCIFFWEDLEYRMILYFLRKLNYDNVVIKYIYNKK